MPGHPWQVSRPPVLDTVPGELDQHEGQHGDLDHDDPDHVVCLGAGAHLLVVKVQNGTVTLYALHVFGVLDQVAVLVEELLDRLNVVAVTGPGVVRQIIRILVSPHLMMLHTRFVQHWLQRSSVQLKYEISLKYQPVVLTRNYQL